MVRWRDNPLRFQGFSLQKRCRRWRRHPAETVSGAPTRRAFPKKRIPRRDGARQPRGVKTFSGRRRVHRARVVRRAFGDEPLSILYRELPHFGRRALRSCSQRPGRPPSATMPASAAGRHWTPTPQYCCGLPARRASGSSPLRRCPRARPGAARAFPYWTQVPAILDRIRS